MNIEETRRLLGMLLDIGKALQQKGDKLQLLLRGALESPFKFTDDELDKVIDVMDLLVALSHKTEIECLETREVYFKYFDLSIKKKTALDILMCYESVVCRNSWAKEIL